MRCATVHPRAARVLGLLLLSATAFMPAVSASGAKAVLAAAGDIACDPGDPRWQGGRGTADACRMADTAALLADLAAGEGLDAVLLLGDNQYEDGALGKYKASFDPAWGRFLPITRPAAGNHEYGTPGAAGYFAYFGAAAGGPGRSWYSFDLAGWHVIVLDSNCDQVGGCGAGSPQMRWLAADLAAHPDGCKLAAWHHPRFSSGVHGDDPRTGPFWEALYRAGADVVLSGHDHDYERFAPQDPSGRDDPAGPRQFVVGTGGKDLRPFATPRPNSEVRATATFGVLALTLRPGGYEWRFLPAAGGAAIDASSGTCHAAADDALILHGGRFRAEVVWRDFAGGNGTGHPVSRTAGDSGIFWFFAPENWELMVKVIDACAVNGRWWVFAAGLTSVEYELTVTDTATGAQVRYANPLGRTSPAVADSAAFECP